MKKKSLVTAVLVGALVLCAPGVPAMADQLVIPPPNTTVAVKGSPGLLTPNATVILDGTLSGSTTVRITPPGGTQAGAIVRFSTYANFGSTAITTAVLSGTSSALWQGFNPAKASSIKLSDKIWSTGLGLTVSYPGSVASITSNTVVISNTVTSTYVNSHSISNLKFSGTLFTVNQEATGTFRFGSYTAIVYAS